MKNQLVEQALAYADKGWAVFPVYEIKNGNCSCRAKGKCPSPGKHPRTGKGVKDATINARQIRQWWQKWPHANIGIATGKVSGLLVVDLDLKGSEDGLESWRQLCADQEDKASTLTVTTGGGGKHLYFCMPNEDLGNKTRIRSGVDIRANGGYVLAPPSSHISGEQYQWDEQWQSTELACVPDWLQTMYIRPTKHRAKSTEWMTLKGKAHIEENIPQNANTGQIRPNDNRVSIIPKGRRNDTLFRLGTSFRSAGAGRDTIQAALYVENEKKCKPPLEDREMETIVESVIKYKPNEISLREGFTMIPNNWVDFNLSSPEFHVLWRLVSFMYRGNTCFPSLATLAEGLPFGERSLRSHIRALEDKGLVQVQHRYANSNIYTFTPDNCKLKQIWQSSSKSIRQETSDKEDTKEEDNHKKATRPTTSLKSA